MALAGCVLVLGVSTGVFAQCAYPALELLEFDYVNRPQPVRSRTDEGAAHNVCLTAPIRHPRKQEMKASGIEYEFEARLFVLQKILRWLHLDSVAEAWASFPTSNRSR